jgi:hypothetical protein
MVGVVRFTTLARLVLLACLSGASSQGLTLPHAGLSGRGPGEDVAVKGVAARHGAVEAIALGESARLKVSSRSTQANPAVPAANSRLASIDPVGACDQRRRASGQSAVSSAAALRGPPTTI